MLTNKKEVKDEDENEQNKGNYRIYNFSCRKSIVCLFDDIIRNFTLTNNKNCINTICKSSEKCSLLAVQHILIPFKSVVFEIVFKFSFKFCQSLSSMTYGILFFG